MTTEAKLRAESLTKRYGGGGEPVVAVRDVDLEIADGEFVALLGPSGCGKSTLLGMLSGLIQPSEGRIWLDGAPTDRLLGRVGLMPQKDLLMPWRTVLDNAILGLVLRDVSRGEARERAREELDRFGLTGFEDRWPASLSGGMRQRAALLRTFLAGRDVMLLDEPFGALDALTRQTMQAWLLEIWAASRKTILFVTHDVDEAVFLADRVYMLSGRPGHVELCVDVDLPRPRALEVMTEPKFVALKHRLLEPLLASHSLLAKA